MRPLPITLTLTFHPMRNIYSAFISAIRQRSVGAIVMVLLIMGAHYYRTGRVGWQDLVAGVFCYVVVIVLFTGVAYARRNDVPARD